MVIVNGEEIWAKRLPSSRQAVSGLPLKQKKEMSLNNGIMVGIWNRGRLRDSGVLLFLGLTKHMQGGIRSSPLVP